MTVIRRAHAGDLDAVAAIQATSPKAAQWAVAEYLQYEFMVAILENAVAGFAVWRMVAQDEAELLNLVVAPQCRRQGVARQLLTPLLEVPGNQVFLEVRESNQGARFFYKSMGFKEVSTRGKYYEFPPDTAIVMKFHSC